MMQTIDFFPCEWDSDDFNGNTDRIECDYQWYEGDATVGLLSMCEKRVKWMRGDVEIKDITDELSFNDLAYVKHLIQRNDEEMRSLTGQVTKSKSGRADRE
jgi:hypothetical protein